MNHYVFITLDLAYRSIYKEINFLFIFFVQLFVQKQNLVFVFQELY